MPDFWSVTETQLIRHHSNLRTTLYVPSEDDNCPIPLKFLDVARRTYADFEAGGPGEKTETEIQDCWRDDGDKELKAPWYGKTIFLLRLPPMKTPR